MQKSKVKMTMQDSKLVRRNVTCLREFACAQSSNGQTLVEAMLAVAIISISVVGGLSLLSQLSNNALRAQNQFLAANLAQEGVEFVQNIRTTNWVRNRNWLINLSLGTFCSDFTVSPPLLTVSESACPLFLNASNMYVSASTANSTHFSRLITLANGTDSDGKAYLDVQSTITWGSGGGSIIAEDRLYDWK